MLKNIIFIGFFILIFNGLKAQSITPSVINSTGGGAIINNNLYQWSVGETYMSMNIGNNIIVSSGFLQPFMEKTPEPPEDIGTLNVYPNPVYNALTVSTDFAMEGQLTFRLYQTDGKLLLERNRNVLPDESFAIDMSQISGGNYIIDFSFREKGTKRTQRDVFKIQKIN
jgi:hypothetical protein